MRRTISLIPGGRRLVLLVLPLVIGVGIFTAAYVNAQSNRPASGALLPVVQNLDVPPPSGLLVDVSGAVNHPGLYRMRRGDRVYDAIAAAGGLTDQADPTRLPNLAGRLRDGEQVKVPFARGTPGSIVITRTNLNTATVEELEVLPGFTPAFALEVIDYRTNFGGFQNIRELVEVLGMSEAEFVIARRYLTL
ncbi:MAG TPA: helix-hairpin-helix domain-containing protein [Candidatus Dormibacteraeota bacterium]|nr:helix-hairpin-helix domain-containing protein [Candidatus Dormibacteraeota bacterium]